MTGRQISGLVFGILMAFIFVVFATYDAVKEGSGWLSIAGIVALGAAVPVAGGLLIFTDWGCPAGYKNWRPYRIRRSYERNVSYANLWLKTGLGFMAGTVLALIPLLWNIGAKGVDLSPWRVAVIVVAFLLFVIGLGSFLMFAKYRQFYERDDRRLG